MYIPCLATCHPHTVYAVHLAFCASYYTHVHDTRSQVYMCMCILTVLALSNIIFHIILYTHCTSHIVGDLISWGGEQHSTEIIGYF